MKPRLLATAGSRSLRENYTAARLSLSGALAALALSALFAGVQKAAGGMTPTREAALAFAIRWFGWTALLGAGIAAVLELFRRVAPSSHKRVASWMVEFGGAAPRGIGAALAACAGCAVLVAGLDGQAFRHGFFRLDDFHLLSVARTVPFPAQLWLAHGDHSMPLFRVELAGLLASAGASPACFNTANFFGCTSLLIAGCWLLAEMRARWASLVVFATVTWAWPGWAEFTEGYYVLSVYVQSGTFGLVALAALIRGSRTGETRWFVLSALGTLAAALIDLSGVWVFGAELAFLWAVWPDLRTLPRAARCAIALGVGAFLVVLAFNGAVFRHGGFLIQAGPPPSISATALAVVSGIAGRLCELALPFHPAFLFAHSLAYGAEAIVLAGAMVVAWRVGRRMDSRDRRLLVAIGASLLGCIALVAVARHPDEAGFFWPPKWTCLAHVWLVIAVALIVDRTLLHPTNLARSLGGIAAGLIVVIWLSFTGSAIASAVHAPQGRVHALARAQGRTREFARFQAAVTDLARRSGSEELILAPVSIESIARVFPLLENYPLEDLLAALPPGSPPVVVQSAPLRPAVAEALRTVPDFAALYRDSP